MHHGLGNEEDDVDPRLPWQTYAHCREDVWEEMRPLPHDPELFFPQRVTGGQCAPAKSVCRGCPVKAECLKQGISEPFGVWGGLSEQERRRAHQMNKAGMSISDILAVFAGVEPRRKRDATIRTLSPLPNAEGGEGEGRGEIDLTSLIPTQREPNGDEMRERERARRRNGL